MEKPIDQGKFVIQRYDGFINGANVKGNFLLAFNIFLIGAITTNFQKLKDDIDIDNGKVILAVLFIILIILSIIATIFILKAVYPFLQSGNSSSEKYHSHIFFNSVAEFESCEKFHTSFDNQSDADVVKDLCKQAYQLAQGLRKKYRDLGIAIKVIYMELIIMALILLTIIIF